VWERALANLEEFSERGLRGHFLAFSHSRVGMTPWASINVIIGHVVFILIESTHGYT
jgi:hypothetical protein